MNDDVHIGYAPKLLEQVAGEKGDERIFRGDDLVRSIDVVREDFALCIVVVVGEVFVEEDGALRARLLLAREEVLDLELGELVVPNDEAIPRRRHELAVRLLRVRVSGVCVGAGVVDEENVQQLVQRDTGRRVVIVVREGES